MVACHTEADCFFVINPCVHAAIVRLASGGVGRFRLGTGGFPAEPVQPGLVKRQHEGGDKNELENDSGDGIEYGGAEENVQRKRIGGHAGDDEHCKPPNRSAGDHRRNKGAVQRPEALPAARTVDKPCDKTVGRQLKGHGKRRDKRGHSEDGHPEQRQDQPNKKAVLPAADESAYQHGDVHGQKHAADLG